MSIFEKCLSSRHYCNACHAEIESDVEIRLGANLFRLESWCKQCRDIVYVSSCKVPYWTIGATGVVGLVVQI